MNRKNKMFGSFSGMVLSVVMGALPLFAKECVWNANGSGGWGSSSRWVDGNVPDTMGDTVLISGENVTATVADADASTFANVASVTIEKASSSLAFANASDLHTATVFNGSGKVVKNGNGTLYLENTTAKDVYTGFGQLVINAGTVQLPNESSTDTFGICKTEVNDPGVLSICANRPTSISGGLTGDGFVKTSGTSTQQLYLFGGSAENPPVFAGRFLPAVALTPYFYSTTPSYQNLTGNETDYEMTIRISGIVGVTNIGKTGQPSALGSGQSIGFYSAVGSKLLYLGEGEETDKWFYNNGSSCMHLDAGPNGGIAFKGRWWLSEQYRRFGRLVIEGENRVKPCVVNGVLLDDRTDKIYSTYVTKQGTGVWKFEHNTDHQLHGAFAVKRGTLQFASIAEKGTVCSLGFADRTVEDVCALTAAPISYAYMLGDGDHDASDEFLGTMEYVGTSAGACTTRPLVVNGAGRLSATDAPLSFAGITSANAGTNMLILAGSASGNSISSVTNGPGRLNVIKRGTGGWTLAGGIDVNAAESEAGTLELGTTYRYYRMTFREPAKNGCYGINVMGLAFVAADGTVQNGTLGTGGIKTSAYGKPLLLEPGELTTAAAYGYAGGTPRPIDWAFLYNSETGAFGKSDPATFAITSTEATPANWRIVYFRLPADSKPVAKYDILSKVASYDGKTYTEEGTNGREPKSWSIEGSVDGVKWDMLHDVTCASNMVVTGANRWYSNDSTTLGGFEIPSGPAFGCVKAVRAASGATVVAAASAGVTVDTIVYDANGCGTLKGVALAANGTVEAINVGSDRSNLPSYVLTDVTGAENLDNWKVTVNGRKSGWTVRRTETGFTLLPPGILILVK